MLNAKRNRKPDEKLKLKGGEKMDKYILYQRKARKLVKKLTLAVKNDPSVMRENYGQKETRKLIDEIGALKYGILTYQEQCNIKDILYQVSSIC